MKYDYMIICKRCLYDRFITIDNINYCKKCGDIN